jgi:uncharacterized repeat protein (TIGR04076 family)
MKVNSIKCEVIDVRTKTGVCAGIARVKKGESYIIDGRTPEADGMCSNAFCALSNSAYIMMVTNERPGETEGYFDRVCPHGVVTYRLSRSNKEKVNPFDTK